MSQSKGALIRSLCREAGVKFYRGKNFPQTRLILPADIPRLFKFLANRYRPMPFTRLAILTWLTGLDEETELFKRSHTATPSDAGFARRMEIEVIRIARLEEPARTIAAVELVKRIRDASTIASLAKKYLRDGADRIKAEDRTLPRQQWWKELIKLTAMGQKD